MKGFLGHRLPDALATTRSAACAASRVGADGGWSGGHARWAAGWAGARRLTSAYVARAYANATFVHSNHHVKMVAAYAVLDAPATTALFFLDMDAVVARGRWGRPPAPVAPSVEINHWFGSARATLKPVSLAQNEVFSARSWTGVHLYARTRGLADLSRHIRSNWTMLNVS